AATTPLALAHFQQAPTYGLVANLAAMPAMAFLVMPMAILAGCLAPFGLADLPLTGMAWGVDFVLWAAHLVAGWPGDVVRAPASPGWTVAAFMGGGAVLCALRGRIRLIGLVGPAIAVAGLVGARAPDVLVADDGRLAGVVREGTLYVTSERRGTFEAEVWTRLTGASTVRPLQSADPAWARCDERGCAVALDRVEIALSFAAEGFAEDCKRAAVVVAMHAGRATEAMGCAPGVLVIDGLSRARNGAQALRVADGRVRIETVRETQGDRLWSGWRAADDP
ncbi:MAG: ComEC/Rec2 family competence protein, partial [Alphaproteobacteria bacterium]